MEGCVKKVEKQEFFLQNIAVNYRDLMSFFLLSYELDRFGGDNSISGF